MFKCSPCKKVYASKNALRKHDRQFHEFDLESRRETRYECRKCENSFSSKRKLHSHNSVIHKKTQKLENNIYKCHICALTFLNKFEIINHVKFHNPLKPPKKVYSSQISCAVEDCEEVFKKYKHLHSHLIDYHQICISQETHQFRTIAEFNEWKTKKEHELKANYVLNTGKKYLQSGIRTYYACHRSFAPRISENRMRHLKSLGTNKIGGACPSILIVTTGIDNISVVFYPTHVGHGQKLGCLRIDEADRNKIAGKLSQGVTVERVLNDIRENVPDGNIERVHLLEKKDIHNIMRDYSISYSTKRHNNDAISVKLWVEAMNKLDVSPVLYYKQQAEQGDNQFEQEDFILIIMTEFQANSLISFGKNKICIDGTHGLNQYGFQLFTIMVVDEYASGLPVAFCFSNRSDTVLFRTFFQSIQDRVGVISTSVFMSDDYTAFYLAWENVMGIVPQRLLCTWHINKNWIQNSSKITNKEKRQLVLKSLKILQKELDEDIFLTQLETFISQLMTDSDTFQFYLYFSRTYVNRTNMWAYCYRKYAGINTNMYLESLHKVIKHFYLEGKKCKRLDKTINALMKLIRDKMFERVIKFEKQKVSEKIKKIQAAHTKAETIPDDYISCIDDNKWYVVSLHDNTQNYLVEHISDNCNNLCELKCQLCTICIHSFHCSCPDNVIRHNICKHIHACCLKYLFSKRLSPETNDYPSCSLLDNSINLPQSHNKDVINSKLEIILGLNNKLSLSDNNASQVETYLNKIINIYNTNGQIDFKIKENVNTNKKIETQTRMFSSKNKKRRVSESQVSQPLLNESKSLKLALSYPDMEVLHIQTGFDHTYC